MFVLPKKNVWLQVMITEHRVQQHIFVVSMLFIRIGSTQLIQKTYHVWYGASVEHNLIKKVMWKD